MDQRDFLGTQRYLPNVHGVYLTDRCPELDDVSFVVPCGPGRGPVAALGIFGAKCRETLPPGKEVVSVYLSEPRSWELMGASRAEQGREGWRGARLLLPALPRHAELLHVEAREEAMPLHGVGRYAQAANFLTAQRGPIVFAGDYLATGSVEGALRSGARAAEALLEPERRAVPRQPQQAARRSVS